MKLSRKSRCRCCHNVIACTENGHESPVFIPRMHNMHTMHTYHTCHACAAKLSRKSRCQPTKTYLAMFWVQRIRFFLNRKKEKSDFSVRLHSTSTSTDIKPEEVCLGRNLARERLARRRTETQRYREPKRHRGTQSNLWHEWATEF